MYETFTAAQNAALYVIKRYYEGNKMACVVVETKTRSGTWFSFRFYETDTQGEFRRLPDGSQERRTRI